MSPHPMEFYFLEKLQKLSALTVRIGLILKENSAVQMNEAFLKDFHWLKLVHVDLFTLKVSTNEKPSFSKSDSLIGSS